MKPASRISTRVAIAAVMAVALSLTLFAHPGAGAGPVTLQSGVGYSKGWTWYDSSGRYRLTFQSDGNLVLYEDQHPHALWDSHTWGSDAQWLVMEANGNLALYNNSGTRRWQTNTAGNPGSYGSLQNDGNLVVYRPSGSWTWNAATWQLPAFNQADLMDDFSFGLVYQSWRDNVTSSGAGTITSYTYLSVYPWLDWTNDSCSAPLTGDGPFNFNVACERHDFGYRNLKRAQRDYPLLSFWSGRNRNAVDSRLLADMNDRCDEWNIAVRGQCFATASVYYAGVQAFGGPFSTSGYGATNYTY